MTLCHESDMPVDMHDACHRDDVLINQLQKGSSRATPSHPVNEYSL